MTQIKTILLIKFILIICCFTTTCNAGAISRGYARRRRVAKQKVHIQNMLNTQTISIFNTEYYAISKYMWHWDMCPLLLKLLNTTNEFNTPNKLNEFQEKNITETVDAFYLENIYTKEHFPLTYRDNVILTSSFVNVTKYFEYHCYKNKPINNTFIYIILAGIAIYTLFTFI